MSVFDVRRGVAVALVGLAAVGVSPVAASAATVAQERVWAAQNAEIDRYGVEHPMDLAGLERLVEKYTGKKTQVAVNGVEGTMTGERAQQILDARRAEWARQDEGKPSVFSPQGTVPTDAFNVSVQFVPVVGPPPRIKARGNWDFRDNYVNGSNPDDFSSVQVKLAGNQRIVSTTTLTYDYKGNQTSNVAYLKDSGLNSNAPISGIRDRVSGFVTNFDHGFTEVLVENSGDLGAAYAYEHNQDSDAGASASASFGVLSVSYTSSTPALQKGAGPIYRRI
uniref:hypothetical protein n=1 Tax=Actinokineospora sp. CA-119265 TaxID=3239890 RepID=UPI003F492445